MPRPRYRPLPLLALLREGKGFSLIEVIFVLVLLGIIGLGVGLGINNVIEGFMASRDAAAIAAKGQLALLRLSREFRVVKAVASASATSIQFTAKHGETDADDKTYTITKSGATVTMNDGTNTDILVDKVNALALAYYDTYNGAAQTTWTSARKIIEVTITLDGPKGTPISFVTRVTPRNM